jgi:ribose 5-phosphate isomerase A
MSWREQAKKRASKEAVKHVEDGFILGLGSGSTVAYAIQEIGKRIKQEGLNVSGVPTSHQAFALAIHNEIPTTTLDEHPQLNLAIDGADQIDTKLNLIKGMGGALTREKIVASVAKQVIIVADETKLTTKLGTKHAVPVEALPFAASTITSRVEKMGGKAVLRESKGKIGPVVTDNGNFILDVNFGPINNPKELDCQLKSIPGILETGLFINMADITYVGTQTTVQRLERTTRKSPT